MLQCFRWTLLWARLTAAVVVTALLSRSPLHLHLRLVLPASAFFSYLPKAADNCQIR